MKKIVLLLFVLICYLAEAQKPIKDDDRRSLPSEVDVFPSGIDSVKVYQTTGRGDQLENTKPEAGSIFQIFYFNKDGKPRSIVQFKERGRPASAIFKYHYSDSNITRVELRERSNEVSYVWEIRDTLVIKETAYKNGKIAFIWRFDYNAANKLLTTQKFDERNILLYYNKLSYNDNGNAVQYDRLIVGVSAEKYNYLYDEQQNLIRTEFRKSGSVVPDKSVYITRDSLNRLESERTLGLNGVSISHYAFNYSDNNNLIEIQKLSESGSIIFSELYEYDLRGNVTNQSRWEKSAPKYTVFPSMFNTIGFMVTINSSTIRNNLGVKFLCNRIYDNENKLLSVSKYFTASRFLLKYDYVYFPESKIIPSRVKTLH